MSHKSKYGNSHKHKSKQKGESHIERHLTKYDVLAKQGLVELKLLQRQLAQTRKANAKESGTDPEWSDEEHDYKWQIPKPIITPPTDLSNIDDPTETTKGKIHTIPKHLKKHDFSSEPDYIKNKNYGFNRQEKEHKKIIDEEFKFDIPLPRYSGAAKNTLGERTIKIIWKEFILSFADESEMIQLEQMSEVIKNVENELGYNLPFDEINYGDLDEDDYIEFNFVIEELVKLMHKRGEKGITFNQDNPVKSKFEYPLALPPCCAFESCIIHKYGWSGHENKSESMALNGAFNRVKLQQKGNVRIKDLPLVCDAAKIEYDMSSLDENFLRLRGEYLIENMKQLESYVNMIRTDEVDDDGDDIYKVPKWLAEEFTGEEILMFKHHFTAIDIDGGGDVDAEELQILTESLGSRVTIEVAQELIDEYDDDKSGSIDFGEFLSLMFKIKSGTVNLSTDVLASTLLESKAQSKIFTEIEKVNIEPPNEYCTVSHYGQTPVVAVFNIKGPVGSVYEGGVFALQVTYHAGYPFKMPEVKFLTRIFHINVITQLDSSGHMKHLEYLWDSKWNSSVLLNHIVELLIQPKITYIPVQIRSIVFRWMKDTKNRLESFDVFDEEDGKVLYDEMQAMGIGTEEVVGALDGSEWDEHQEGGESVVENEAEAKDGYVHEIEGKKVESELDIDVNDTTTAEAKKDVKIVEGEQEQDKNLNKASNIDDKDVILVSTKKEGDILNKSDEAKEIAESKTKDSEIRNDDIEKGNKKEENTDQQYGQEGKSETIEEEREEEVEIESLGFKYYLRLLPRVEQMHVNVISLYLCDFNTFLSICTQFVENHRAPVKEEEEETNSVMEDVGNHDSMAVDVDASMELYERSREMMEINEVPMNQPPVTKAEYIADMDSQFKVIASRHK